MSIGNHGYKILNRLKINLFTPCRVLGSKLIFFAPHGAGVNEENQWIYMHDYR